MARRGDSSGKALKAHGRVSFPGGPCFAVALKPSKWTMATWPGAGKAINGKALKAHKISCPGGPCFAAVFETL